MNGCKLLQCARRSLGAVDRDDCDRAAKLIQKKCSPAWANAITGALRLVFAVAVRRGLAVENPALKLPPAKINRKALHLPSIDQFQQLLARMDKKSKHAAMVARLRAFTGMRANESSQVTPEMVDWQRNALNLPGSITKSGLPRTIPIIAELAPHLRKWLTDYTRTGMRGPILPCYDIRGALRTHSKALKIPLLTNHGLRHLFATHCLESGIDVKTVAEWLGHQDGGALLLRTYAHLRNEHSQEMAKLVRFSPDTSTAQPIQEAQST